MLVFAHLSDTHFDGARRGVDRATAVMDHLNGIPYDLGAVLVTGDIADHGLAGEYEEARKVLASRHPVLVCPGNHDVREPFRRVLLGEPAGDGPVNRAFNAGRAAGEGSGAVIALCDSSIPGRDDGRLDDETLAWLAGVLADTPPEVPVLVAFHHPPVALHSPYVDRIRQFGEERLAELIGRHPNVVAILCGHAHTPAATRFADRPVIVAPGVTSTVRLPWERGREEDLLDLDTPPAFAFHVLDDDWRLTTHYRVVA